MSLFLFFYSLFISAETVAPVALSVLSLLPHYCLLILFFYLNSLYYFLRRAVLSVGIIPYFSFLGYFIIVNVPSAWWLLFCRWFDSLHNQLRASRSSRKLAQKHLLSVISVLFIPVLRIDKNGCYSTQVSPSHIAQRQDRPSGRVLG